MNDPLDLSSHAVGSLVEELLSGSRDRSVAEDALQDAWVEALRKRVPAEGLGDWLRGALALLTRSRQRDEARRREREQRAVRDDAEPSALDSLAEREFVQRVSAAVRGLDEPYRTVILLRYDEGLAPRHIARRLGVPLNTARSRLRRGLEELRKRLDPAVLFALVPPLRLTEFSRATRLRAPREAWGLTLVVGGVVLVVGASALLTRNEEAESVARVGSHVSSLAVEEDAGRETRRTSLEATPSSRASLAVHARQSVDSQSVAKAVPATTIAAEITGQLFAADGSAWVGAKLVLHIAYMSGSAVASPALTSADANPLAAWRDLEALTDEEGRFAVAFEPLAGFGYGLWLAQPPGAEAEWSWLTVAAGERIDLGQVHFGPGATLEGRVVDGTGRARVDEVWLVSASAFEQRSDTHHFERSFTAEYDPRRAAFVLRGLPEGALDLRLSAPNSGQLAGLTLELVGGEHRIQDLVYTGPDPGRCLRLVASARGHSGLVLQLEGLRLVSTTGVSHAPRRVENSLGSYMFTDLGPEEHTLTCDDPRFEPHARAGLFAGESVRLELVGSAALRLSVVERATGAPLARFAVALEPLAPRQGGLMRLHDGAVPLADGRLSGLVPGSYVVHVGAAGFAQGTRELLELEPGETRALALALDPAPRLTGTVRRADGSVGSGLTVACYATDAQRGSAFSGSELARATCDERGAFELEFPRLGACLLYVLSPNDGAPLSVPLALIADGSVEGLVLTYP